MKPEFSFFLLVRCSYNKQIHGCLEMWNFSSRIQLSPYAHSWETGLKRLNCTSLYAHALFSIYFIKNGGIRSSSKSIKMLSSQWRYHNNNYYFPYTCVISFHIISSFMHAFWLVLTYDLLEDGHIQMMTALNSSLPVAWFFEPLTILC